MASSATRADTSPRPPRPPERPPLSADAEEFLAYLSAERGRAASSLSSYRRDLLAYEDFLRGRDLELSGASAVVVEEYLRLLESMGRAPATRARALAAIRGLHGFALAERSAPGDPTLCVAAPRVPAGLPKALTEDEVEGLLASVVGDDARALRDRAVLEVLYATGARISELVGLSLRDLDLEARLVRLFGKGSKERIVPVGGPAVAALEAWMAPGGRSEMVAGRRLRRDDLDAVFVSTRGRRMDRQAAWVVVHAAAVRAGLAERVTPHVLRHSCATHQHHHGADIRVVQELLGHASITTTQVYTKVSQEHLLREYRSAHPRALATRRVR
ncbi:MAG: tyrosine recombinase [Acidimicrobiales bacterium]